MISWLVTQRDHACTDDFALSSAALMTTFTHAGNNLPCTTHILDDDLHTRRQQPAMHNSHPWWWPSHTQATTCHAQLTSLMTTFTHATYSITCLTSYHTVSTHLCRIRMRRLS